MEILHTILIMTITIVIALIPSKREEKRLRRYPKTSKDIKNELY